MIDFPSIRHITTPKGELQNIKNANGKLMWWRRYVNQIPISTDANGNIYNGKGWKENIKFSSSDGAETTQSGHNATGYIPIGYSTDGNATGEQVIYLSKTETLSGNNNTRIALYTSDKTFMGVTTASQWNTSATYNGTYYTLGSDGYINMIDISGTTAEYHNGHGKDAAYFRICAPGLDGDSVITVNEEINENRIPLSINSDGTLYVGTNGEKGYKTNTRLSSGDGSERTSSANGLEVTGFIPVKFNDTVYLKGITVQTATWTTIVTALYDSSFQIIANNYTVNIFGETSGEMVSAVINNKTFVNENVKADNVAYIRIATQEINADSIITVNQEIV